MGFLTPYLTYIKIAVFVGALALTGWTTHEWDRRGYEAKQTQVLEVQVRKDAAAMTEYRAKVAAQATVDEDIGRAQRDTLARLSVMVGKLNGELRNAQLDKGTNDAGKVVDLGRYVFTGDFVRLYNSPIDRVNGYVSTDPAHSNGTPWANGAVTDVTRDEVLRNNAELLTTCGKWKSRLDQIDAWDKRTFKEK